jgi:hypothetical protein
LKELNNVPQIHQSEDGDDGSIDAKLIEATARKRILGE